MVNLVRGWQEADDILHVHGNPQLREVKRRRVANNTYLERQGPDRIAVVLHTTDVVTYCRTDEGPVVEINTGGWLTVTTKARINDYLPSDLRVDSAANGRWHLTTWNGEREHVAWLNDGMGIRRAANGRWHVVYGGLPDDQREREDRHNAKVNKLITAYIKYLLSHCRQGGTTLNDKPIDLPPVDCVQCQPVSVGNPLALEGRTEPPKVPTGQIVSDVLGAGSQHLIDHLVSREYVPAMIEASLFEIGWGPSGYALSYWSPRSLRRSLRQRLLVGMVAGGPHGRRPRDTWAWQSMATQRYRTIGAIK